MIDLDVTSFGEVVATTTGASVDDLPDCCIAGASRLPLVELFAKLGSCWVSTGTTSPGQDIGRVLLRAADHPELLAAIEFVERELLVQL